MLAVVSSALRSPIPLVTVGRGRLLSLSPRLTLHSKCPVTLEDLGLADWIFLKILGYSCGVAVYSIRKVLAGKARVYLIPICLYFLHSQNSPSHPQPSPEPIISPPHPHQNPPSHFFTLTRAHPLPPPHLLVVLYSRFSCSASLGLGL